MYGAMLQPPDARRRRHLVAARCACRAARRCRSRSARASRRRSAARSSRATACRETSPVASFNHPDRERKPGSIGTPIEGVEMKVVDDDGNDVAQGEVGEIVIRGHNVMKGYWKQPGGDRGGDRRDGWFHTGDMAQDRRGRLLLHRRPQEGPDHPRRLQRLPARDRGGPLRAPGRRARPRSSACPTTSWARRSAPPSRSRTGEDVAEDELRAYVKEQRRGLQVPAPRLVRRRAAQGADRQDPQARDRDPRQGRDRLAISTSRSSDRRMGGRAPAGEESARGMVRLYRSTRDGLAYWEAWRDGAGQLVLHHGRARERGHAERLPAGPCGAGERASPRSRPGSAGCGYREKLEHCELRLPCSSSGRPARAPCCAAPGRGWTRR